MPCDLSNHDITVPYTEEEADELVRIFRRMPTFRHDANGGTIESCDMELFHRSAGDNKRTPMQYAAYKSYWDANFNGIIPKDEMVGSLLSFHDTARLFKERARICDVNGDGFIDAQEFEEFVKVCFVHEPKLQGVSYAEFVEQADENKDGKVSLEEFGTWIEACLRKFCK